MKTSNYNFFYQFEKDENKMIAYNSRSNALALMEKDQYEKFDNFTNNAIEIDDEKLVENLKNGLFLIEDEINELDVLSFNLLKSRYIKTNLTLTIAPTMNCNFDCVYCYEKDNRKSARMSQDVQDKIIELVKNNLRYIETLHVAWYGGEPMLALDVIENLSVEFIKLCKEKNVDYNASVVTNGYKLNKDTAEKLKKSNVNFIQVTLDGPEEIHNQRRPLIGGQPTFNKILENLSEAIETIPNISLRINTDKENIERIDELLESLDKYNLRDKIYPYMGYVEPTNECYSQNKCLTFDNFSKSQYDFDNTLVKENFSKDIVHKYPYLKSNCCGADTYNSYVIDPNGDMYKCWSDIGMKEYRIGNLLKDNSNGTNTKRVMQYLLYDATKDEECIECKFIPLCMGGCARRRLDKQVERCTNYKYTLEAYLQSIAATLYERKQSNEECDKDAV